ncbi:unnamed protein product [Vitrella brassicaformis CCMP3155]|uniref:Aspartate aminotransferase n=1 Tax=Vitrella brassicaformis (strain CCMP3155) TaxID=1169540 RepID=A0A0G4FHR4_VITBC|nr:unnamed protein product [Vitrella brassicaformis CCMP3155]|eukprot:CEM13057.1 unnamed protein product [Vitrella brassicaformis CCMP3155]
MSLSPAARRLAVISLPAARQQAAAVGVGIGRCRSRVSWAHVRPAPPDPILGLNEAYLADTDKRKINLSVGAYRDNQGQPWVLPSVRRAEELRLQNEDRHHEYNPITGKNDFVRNAVALAYGEDLCAARHIAAAQSLSGTGALRVAAEWLHLYFKGNPVVYLPQPTWSNHPAIFHKAGLQTRTYRYFDTRTKGLDLKGMLEDLDHAEPMSIVLLHACAHNPTGVDPSRDEWGEILEVINHWQHLVVFDMAYQGFATGSVERDAWPVREFVRAGHQVMLAQSFAKNMGLYGQRVGCFSMICQSEEERGACESQLKKIIRAMYSSPPGFGSEIAGTILADSNLKAQWFKELEEMSGRINSMRMQLYTLLKDKHHLDWPHVKQQIGMFAYTGLGAGHCQKLAADYHIYLTLDGRISIAGLNDSNIEYVADSFAAVAKDKALH